MAIFRTVVAVSVLFLMVGCAGSAGKMRGLELGMNRNGVVSVMGEPDSISETEGVLYLRYYLSASGFFSEEYFVRLTGGLVDAYGRRGDFGLGY
ncbi:MAG: hypothetical protein PVG78_09350 [Desulfobacterales bacterium]|jgi:hypothetical protein